MKEQDTTQSKVRICGGKNLGKNKTRINKGIKFGPHI